MSLAVAVLSAFALLALPAPSHAGRSAQVDSPWTWTDRGPKLLDVSCADSGRCVAVGEGRKVLRGPVPPAGRLGWSVVGLGQNQDLVAVDCAGNRCVAVSGGNGTTSGVSRVVHSEDGGDTWSDAVQLPPADVAPKVETRVAADVACDPAGACVIAGPAGGIWRSGNGGATWSALGDSKLGLPYRALACPAEDRCMLVGSGGKGAVLNGRDATPVTAAGVGALGAIACESARVCTAAGSLGEVVSIEAPFKKWGAPVLLPNALNIVSLACPAAETCVGITGKGGALRTTARSEGEWRKRPTGSANLLALDCVAARCVAVGKSASWFESADTGVTWGAVNEVAKFNGVTCPAGTGVCVAGGMENIGRSTTGGDLWSLPLADVSGLGIDAVSCAGFPACLALGKDKTLASSDQGLTWRARQPAGSVTAGPAAEACVSADQCMGVGGGAIYTTFDSARSGWSIGSIPTAPGEMVKGIACPTANRCVVASSDGIYRGDLSTAGGEVVWTWIASDADPSDPINGIACATATSCVAVGFNGQVFTTSDPQLLAWSRQRIGSGPPSNRPPLLTVACPAAGICVAGGNGGYVATTANGWADWSLDQIGSGNGPQPTIAGFGCESPTRCVAVGDTVFGGARAG